MIWLKDAELGIFHAGVEVYGEEWSFQYFEDTWNDPSVSGLIRCLPKRMVDYEYQESINLGPTTLTQLEVDQLLLTLQDEWPACSYHLTHNNCLTFAEHFAERLKVPNSFPPRLRNVLDKSKENQSLDAVVDYSWSWVKWWMIRKHQVEEEDEKKSLPDTPNVWSLFFQPMQSCSGTLCPGGPQRKIIGEETYSVRPESVGAHMAVAAPQ